MIRESPWLDDMKATPNVLTGQGVIRNWFEYKEIKNVPEASCRNLLKIFLLLTKYSFPDSF